MATVNDDKIEARAVGIKADGCSGVALGPILLELTILHDDVVAAANELVDIHVVGAIVEREAETDVQFITHVHP